VEKLIKKAKEDSQIYTWENRGRLILNFVKSNDVKR